MPQILELRKIDGEVWAKIPKVQGDGYFYVWSAEEARQAKESAIRTFCFDLANRYIEDPAKGVGS